MATTLQFHLHVPIPSSYPRLLHFKKTPNSVSFSKKLYFSKKLSRIGKDYSLGSLCCRASNPGIEPLPAVREGSSTSSSDLGNHSTDGRPPFDINLAVILAGFAFEAYTTPPENVGKREMDAAKCQTVFLSESFVREIYDGQLFIKLKKGSNFPAMDPWGTSDPYVIMTLDSQVIKSNVKWGTKEPTWNEEFALNIKHPPIKNLQVAAWDANLVAPHKRMGNSEVNLEHLLDGNMHEVLVDLEGMGGGGKIQLEIKYKSFEMIDEEKKWWRIPIVTEFLQKNGLDSALKMFTGSETVQASQFVQFAFGRLQSLNGADIQKDQSHDNNGTKKTGDSIEGPGMAADVENGAQCSSSGKSSSKLEPDEEDKGERENEQNLSLLRQESETSQSDKQFWKSFADTVNQSVVQKFGLPVPEKIKWDAFDLLNKIGLQSQKDAEAGYIESGLATPENQDPVAGDPTPGPLNINAIQSSLPDVKKVTQDLLRQTEGILGSLMVLNATISQLNGGAGLLGNGDKKEDSKPLASSQNVFPLDDKKAEEMRALFSTAETAMEAWAMLATALGHPSFIKSEFEKICFLDNESTDTQVALWRDSERKRLVIAFRGTEQARWKDIKTDLMLIPAGLNPERIGGNFKEEIQVHSGFLSAYDSVRTRIISLIKQAINYEDDSSDPPTKWHIYVTGHSLGGALATLLALELSSGQLAKHGAISVTMYNFGSPRVGNKKFAELYNEKVKDSWRVVNHRDIIPTVPRLMGYCHVAQPVYLAAGDLQNAVENVEFLEDGYQGDVIGEATPDVLVSEFMKGEKQLIEKILNTEINIFRSIRDGSALMQHMEDFYYITLLENVRLNYQTAVKLSPGEDKPYQSAERDI